MIRPSTRRSNPQGAVLGLTVLLAVLIVGMAAFAVDIGYIVYVQSQLHNAADAAALAGVAQLMQPYVQYNYPNQSAARKAQILSNAVASVRTAAQQYAGFNAAGDVKSLALPDDDVVCGFLDTDGNFSPNPPDTRFPNSVQVTMRRDGTANGPLPLFFAAVFGKTSTTLSVTARATIMESPTNLKPDGQNGLYLPVALDVRVWNQFVQNGTSPSANNKVLTGPNGLPELLVYPDSTQFGSFGLVSIGPPATSVPPYGVWIDSGPTSSDLNYLVQNNLLPVSPQQPQTWPAGPGIKSTLQTDFASIIGQGRLLPLYDGSLPPSDDGYPIIGFAGVTVSTAVARGSKMNISVQPMAVQDPNTIGGSPAGTGSSPTFSFTVPQLTQ